MLGSPLATPSSMEPDRSLYPSQEQRMRFGRTLTVWLNRNGWIHSTMQEWGHQAGFPALRDSSTNRLQNGKTEQPSPLTFFQLGVVNERVAKGDFSGVVERSLKDRLQGSVAITSPDGTPWRATEFFSHFMGELEAPDWAELPQPLTTEEATTLSREHQATFETIAKTKFLSPPAAWKQLEKHCQGMTPSQRDMLRNVLSGWHTWTPADWLALSVDGSDPVADALARWDQQVDD